MSHRFLGFVSELVLVALLICSAGSIASQLALTALAGDGTLIRQGWIFISISILSWSFWLHRSHCASVAKQFLLNATFLPMSPQPPFIPAVEYLLVVNQTHGPFSLSKGILLLLLVALLPLVTWTYGT